MDSMFLFGGPFVTGALVALHVFVVISTWRLVQRARRANSRSSARMIAWIAATVGVIEVALLVAFLWYVSLG